MAQAALWRLGQQQGGYHRTSVFSLRCHGRPAVNNVRFLYCPGMLHQVLSFLIEVLVTLVGGACLLRLYMHARRMSLGNPVGRFVQALSDWLVLPLRRIVPPGPRLDVASLLAAWLLKLLQYALPMALIGSARWSVLPLLALLGVVKLAVSVATAVIVIAAVLSWTGNRTLVTDVVDRLAEPLLAPARKLIPTVGGVDLSPLLVIVALQVLAIVLGSLQGSLWGTGAAVLAG